MFHRVSSVVTFEALLEIACNSFLNNSINYHGLNMLSRSYFSSEQLQNFALTLINYAQYAQTERQINLQKTTQIQQAPIDRKHTFQACLSLTIQNLIPSPESAYHPALTETISGNCSRNKECGVCPESVASM
jgi:hypothetical protein